MPRSSAKIHDPMTNKPRPRAPKRTHAEIFALLAARHGYQYVAELEARWLDRPLRTVTGDNRQSFEDYVDISMLERARLAARIGGKLRLATQ